MQYRWTALGIFNKDGCTAKLGKAKAKKMHEVALANVTVAMRDHAVAHDEKDHLKGKLE